MKSGLHMIVRRPVWARGNMSGCVGVGVCDVRDPASIAVGWSIMVGHGSAIGTNPARGSQTSRRFRGNPTEMVAQRLGCQFFWCFLMRSGFCIMRCLSGRLRCPMAWSLSRFSGTLVRAAGWSGGYGSVSCSNAFLPYHRLLSVFESQCANRSCSTSPLGNAPSWAYMPGHD